MDVHWHADRKGPEISQKGFEFKAPAQVLVYMTMNERKLEDMPDMLSLLVLLRWIQFTWSCRAFHWAGHSSGA